MTDATEGSEAPVGVQEAECCADERGEWRFGPWATPTLLASTAAGVAQPGLAPGGGRRTELRLPRRGRTFSPARLRHRLGPGPYAYVYSVNSFCSVCKVLFKTLNEFVLKNQEILHCFINNELEDGYKSVFNPDVSNFSLIVVISIRLLEL